MNDYVVKNGKKLKTGYTTGSCAAAAAKAAAMMLLSGQVIEQIMLTLPSGDHIMLELEDILMKEEEVSCAVRKNAGDDPDVTHGLFIYAKVKKKIGDTVIDGGIGVGRVTKEGLACKIGEAAINPVPKKMIRYSLLEVAAEYQYSEGFEVEIYVPGGEEVAKNTFNARLGILGGISILGTTGIVEPMSEAALIDTIKLEMSSKRKHDILFVTPGNYGLEFAQANFNLNIDSAVKCSNYIGEMLDYAGYLGFSKILFIGHIGKLVKLAAGVMNTHSKTADCRNEIFAAHSALNGVDNQCITAIMDAVTTDEIHNILVEKDLCEKVYQSIQSKIQFHLNYRVKNQIQIEFIIFSNENGALMQTEHATEFIKKIKELEY